MTAPSGPWERLPRRLSASVGADHGATVTGIRPREVPAVVAVTYVSRRDHDGSVISAHCCRDCAELALGQVSLAANMGDQPPGPLENVWVHVVEMATGQEGMFTVDLMPLDGIAPPELPCRPWTV